MRLIDADELLLKLNRVYDEVDVKYHETDFDSFYGGGCSMIQEIIKEVEEQLAAYDVDKVVEQLKNASYERFRNAGMGGENVVNLDDAIEIVNAGGNNDN